MKSNKKNETVQTVSGKQVEELRLQVLRTRVKAGRAQSLETEGGGDQDGHIGSPTFTW